MARFVVRCCLVIVTALVAAAGSGWILPTRSTVRAAINVSQFRGKGFSISYPSNWQKVVRGEGLTLITPDSAFCFKVSPTGETVLQKFFSSYRMNANDVLELPAQLNGSTEPTVYGAWRGDTISGNGVLNGVPYIVSATGIRANGQIYLFQMAAPTNRSWEAYEVRKALANSLAFDNLPNESHGNDGPCRDCLAMWSSTMNRITHNTR